MNRDRVLVALDRKVAETTVEMGLIAKGHSEICRCSLCSIRDALRAALDTDREQQVERVARAIEGFATDGIDIGWDRCGSARKELARLAARRVLSSLEGADDE